jgi:hypothetical protein
VEGTDSEIGKTVWFELAPATVVAAAAAPAAAADAAVRRPKGRLFRRRRRGLSFFSMFGAARYPKRMLACSTPNHQL